MNSKPVPKQNRYPYGVETLINFFSNFVRNVASFELKLVNESDLEMVRNHLLILNVYLLLMHIWLLLQDVIAGRSRLLYVQSSFLLCVLLCAIGSLKIWNNISRALVSLIALTSPIILVERALVEDTFFSEYQLSYQCITSLAICHFVADGFGLVLAFLVKTLFVVYLSTRLFLLDPQLLAGDLLVFLTASLLLAVLAASRAAHIRLQIAELRALDNYEEQTVQAAQQIMDFVIDSPLYIMTQQDAQFQKELFRIDSSTKSLDSKLDILKKKLQAGSISYYGPQEEDLGQLSAKHLINYLETLFFDERSELIISMNGVLLGRKNKLEEKLQGEEEMEQGHLKTVKELMKIKCEDQNVAYIILNARKVFCEAEQFLQGCKISLKGVSNRVFMLENQKLKFFDLDFVFLEDAEDDDAISLFLMIRELIDGSSKPQKNQKETVAQRQNDEVFLASIAHDIRAPLHAIMSYAEYLMMSVDDCDQEIKSQVRTISANSEHLNVIISDILDRTRFNKGKLTLQISNFSLNTLIEDCAVVLQEMIKDKNIELMQEFRVQATISSDPHRLKRVILNLLTNAAKFTVAGSITVGVDLHEEKDKLIVFVRDTGVGIPPQKLKNLFRAFNSYKDESGKLNQEGIGLGLAISLAIVEKLGPVAHIQVDSTPGEGSCFSFIVFKDVSLAMTMGKKASNKKTKYYLLFTQDSRSSYSYKNSDF